ncbi:MAG: DUF4174 domain-containing protein [Pseudomonadota bacterium]
MGKSFTARLRRGALAATLLSVVSCGVASAAPLSEFAWSARPLLVFGAAWDAPDISAQRQALSDAADGLREREVLVLYVLPNRIVLDRAETTIAPVALRDAFGVDEGDFAVLLIGKDTGVKLRETTPVAPTRLFDLIDAMPMRRNEMRNRRRETRSRE